MHRVSASITPVSDTSNLIPMDLKSVTLDYWIACYDTGKEKEFSETRSEIDGTFDLRPSFSLMKNIRAELAR
jgi:hypothetical protein